jgi:hypothetical protein
VSIESSVSLAGDQLIEAGTAAQTRAAPTETANRLSVLMIVSRVDDSRIDGAKLLLARPNLTIVDTGSAAPDRAPRRPRNAHRRTGPSYPGLGIRDQAAHIGDRKPPSGCEPKEPDGHQNDTK